MKTNLLALFLSFIVMTISTNLFSQCDYPNDVALMSFPSGLSTGNNTIKVKVKVLAMMNEDGTEGVSFQEASAKMVEVASEFLTYGNRNRLLCKGREK